MTSLISIAAGSVKNYSYYWVFTASLPPLLYFLNKKKKLNWLQRLFIKRIEKRASDAKKKVSKSDRQIIGLFIALGIIGTVVGLLVKSGGLTIISVIALIIGLGWALAGKRLHY